MTVEFSRRTFSLSAVCDRRHPQIDGHRPPLQELSWIQNSRRIERILDREMEIARNITRRLRPPALLRQANSVFACDDAAKREHLGDQFIEGPFRSSPDFGFSVVTV